MSAASRKGYLGEHLAELWLEDELAVPLERPRAGAVQDRGDLIGLPLTISVKNRAALDLAGWVDEMGVQAYRNGHPAGVVLHKRKGRGHPRDWYVTTSGAMWLPLLRTYTDVIRRNVVDL